MSINKCQRCGHFRQTELFVVRFFQVASTTFTNLYSDITLCYKCREKIFQFINKGEL